MGWTGCATEPLQAKYGILGAGLIIGAVWALWHLVPWLSQGHALSWVMGQTLTDLIARTIMGWICAFGGRSLFLAIAFHATINTSYSLFPNGGTYYDPFVIAAVLAVMTGMTAFAYSIVGRTSSLKAR